MKGKDQPVGTAATVSAEASAPTVSAEASAPTLGVESAETAAAVTAAPAPLRRGATLGRYVVLEKLGGGGMGVVYTAYDPELDRRIAIKLLRPSAGGSSADARTRLLREAQALARLAHPNVIAVHDVGMFGDQVFVAMEYVEGETLHAWLQREHRTTNEIRDAYLQAGRGLVAAHAVGIVHRDFKPENVLVGKDGRVRVLDFGLARADETASKPDPDMKVEHAETIASAQPGLATPLTSAGEFLGTPAYSSPEQLQGDPADARSDQFSFCVALHEALYGARPFKGSTFGELVTNVLDGAIIPAPAGSRVAPRMRTILLRGLRGKPDERYPSMDELLAAISYDPAAPRRRALIAAGAIVVAGAAGYAVWTARAHGGVRVCEGAGAKLAGIWDEAKRSEIARAFSATSTFGAGALQGVAPLLDAYAKKWTEMSTEACTATRIRGEQSDELLDLREFCLAKRLAALQATTDLLAHPDGKIVENAAVMAQRLPAIDDCADVATLRAVVKPPTDPVVRAEVSEHERAIAKARQLSEAGKLKDATAALPALDAVQALHYRPAEASLLATRGFIEYRAADLKRSIVTLTDGIVAAEAAGDDNLAAAAYLDLMGDLADVKQLDEARLAGRHAAALIERLGGNPRLEGKLLHYQGWIEVYADKDGWPYFDRAREIREHALPPDDADVLESLEIAARFYLGKDDAKALEANQRVLAAREHLYGPDAPPVADSLYSIGSIQRRQGDARTAVATLSRALAIYERSAAETWAPRLFTLRSLALAHSTLGEHDQAVELGKQAVTLGEKLAQIREPADLASALETYAAVLRRKGDYADAAAQIQRAFDVMGTSIPPTSTLWVSWLTELGLDRLGLGHAADALEPLERAMTIVDGYHGSWNSDQAAQARFALARVLRALGKDEPRARELASKAREEWAGWGKGKAAMVAETDTFLATASR